MSSTNQSGGESPTFTSASEAHSDPEIKRRLEWLNDQKLGVLVSWNPCVLWGVKQSWPVCPSEKVGSWARPEGLEPWERFNRDLDAFSKAYFDLYRQFSPSAFDARDLVDQLKAAGVGYAGLTNKHHDGFCLFDTLTTDFKTTSRRCPHASHEQADVTEAFYQALQDHGLGTLCYFSKPDWNSPHYWHPRFPVNGRGVNYDTNTYPEIWEKFKKFTYSQIEELMSNYGRMDILWLDGGWVRPPAQDIDMDQIVAMARTYQPELLVADRTVGGNHEHYPTPEQHVPSEPITGFWEACITLQKRGWTYQPDQTHWSAEELIHRFIRVISDGGNYLVGIGPRADGTLCPEAQERLQAIGAWLEINGEAVYGTRRGDFQRNRANPYIVYTETKDGTTAYAHILSWPEGRLEIDTPPPVDSEGTIAMLGHEEPLAWSIENDRLVVDLSGLNPPNAYAGVLRLPLVTT